MDGRGNLTHNSDFSNQSAVREHPVRGNNVAEIQLRLPDPLAVMVSTRGLVNEYYCRKCSQCSNYCYQISPSRATFAVGVLVKNRPCYNRNDKNQEN